MTIRCLTLATIALAALSPAQIPTVRTTVDEVVLDLIGRDKKGKPVTDLKPEDLRVMDNSVRRRSGAFASWSAVWKPSTPREPEPRSIRSGRYGW